MFEPIVQRCPDLGGRPNCDRITSLQPSVFNGFALYRRLKRREADSLAFVLELVEKIRQPSDEERGRRDVPETSGRRKLVALQFASWREAALSCVS